MECSDTPNADIDSMDLYSRVKLRGLSSKSRVVRKDIFPSKADKYGRAGVRNSKARFGKRRFSLNLVVNGENQAPKNVIAVETARLTSLIDSKIEYDEDAWKNYNMDLSSQNANVHDLDQSNNMLDDGTAFEMLGQLRKGGTENICNQFDQGDLVWGKITSHPWWPGQIYAEALASSAVFSTKKDGCVLVAFFGDYTYAWLEPHYLIPFDIHYAEKSKQTNDRVFLKAVKEATREFKRRAVLGLVCHCQKPSNFRPAMIEGFFEVDFNGYVAGGIYSAKQIEKARDDFQPNETIAFLKQLALSPKNNAVQNLSLMKNIVKIQFYRRVSLQNFDETYVQAIEVHQGSSKNPTGVLVDKEKALLAALGTLLETKSRENQALTQTTIANNLLNDDYILRPKHRVNVSWGWLTHKGSGDHEMQKGSDCFVSEGPQNKPLQKQTIPDGATNAGKKHNISGLQEFPSMKKPVRQNNMKGLESIADDQKVLELQGEERIGIGTNSSVKLENELGMETNSITGCQIAFHNKTDATEAYHHAIQMFSSPVSYELQDIRVAGSELPKSSQSLTKLVEEDHKEIQTQTSLSKAELFCKMKPTFQQLPLPASVKREPCLEELAEEGSSWANVFATPFLASDNDGSEVSQHMIPVSSSTSLCCKTEQFGFSNYVDDIDKKYCQAMKNNYHHTSTSSNGIDDGHQLINLLTSCSGILRERNQALI